MKEDSKVFLNFHDFGYNIQTTWKKLQHEADFSDVTLACEDKLIQAHKIVLSSASQVLENILKTNPNPHPIVYIYGVNFDNFINIVNFIYQGEVNIAEDNLEQFLSIAKGLQVKGLSTKIEEKGYNFKSCTETKESKDKYCCMEHSDSINKSEMMESEAEKTEQTETVNGQIESTKTFIEDKSLPCNQCHKLFEDTQDLEIHMVSAHEKVNYACAECDYKGATKANLMTHFDEVHEACSNMQDFDQNSYPCNQCEKVYKSKLSRKKHQSCAHKGVSYRCDKCDYKSFYKGNMKVHIMSMHELIRYSCDECDYKGTTKGSLTNHIKGVHKGRSYMCTKCKFTANFQASLARHIKTVHQQWKLKPQAEYDGGLLM